MEWTNAGAEYTDTPAKQKMILDEVAGLKWHDLEAGIEGPMSPVLALKGICEEIPGRHKRVTWNGILFERYGLLGLETHYKNGVCQSYWIDIGTGCTCLCQHFVPLADQIDRWVQIGLKNPWIAQASDPFFTRDCFCEVEDVKELYAKFEHGNWCLGQAWYLGDICFINQVNGGAEYLVIKGDIRFESLTISDRWPTLDELRDFVERVQAATDEQIRKLEY